MAVKKNPLSPRQKMINLMYIVLMAMLALNVSTDVLKGFVLVGESVQRTTDNANKENDYLYKGLEEQYAANPQKVATWLESARKVRQAANALYKSLEDDKWRIARQTDGEKGNPAAIENKEDLEAASVVMLNPVSPRGDALQKQIEDFRKLALSFSIDKRTQAIIASHLSTTAPPTSEGLPQKWSNYMFEHMPAIAAVTLLHQMQNDVRQVEAMLLHYFTANIGVKDIRVNELNAYVAPEATTLYPGDEFRSHIFMAAIDTTQRPEIYVNGKKIGSTGQYNFKVGAPGSYEFSGFVNMPNASGEMVRRNFTQKYNVIAPPIGATMAADLMNVLYAGFDNPVSVTATGANADKLSLTMTGGTLVAKGNGKYIARPSRVGEEVQFTVVGEVAGKRQTMGVFNFKVRKLPDPAAYINFDGDHFRGGKVSKGNIIAVQQLSAAIDDGLLNIPFRVLSFESIFFDRLGNVIPMRSAGASFTEQQRETIRSHAKGKRFYISNIRVQGPDGIERNLPTPIEVIIN